MLRHFSDHPASVGETYSEHMGSAFSFGFRLIGAGVACLLHGIFPFLFVKTGSEAVRLLHDRMIVHRDKRTSGVGAAVRAAR
ncbi:MAG: DUF6356 family protein [Parvularculaceae bacterium]